MTGAAIFDGLLAPIPGPDPAGPALRWGPVHAAIEEARREEDADLPQGVWRRDAKRADWPKVVALCREALRDRSKDLQVACWLVEPAGRVHGPAAAADGLRFLGDLAEEWWARLHPGDDGEPDSPRWSPLVWLDGALALLLTTTPVATVADEGESGWTAMSWSDHDAARRREAAQRGAKQPKGARAWPSIAVFDALADRTPLAHLLALADGSAAMDDAAALLCPRLESLGGAAAPGFGRTRAAAQDVAGLLRPILARRPDAAPPAPPPSETFSAEIGRISRAVAAAEPGPPPPPQDRAQAYRALAQIAATLRVLEPHSPTPYLIERAVRWGSMSLPELMADLGRNGKDQDMIKWLMEGSDKKSL